ncbi:MAG: hypothetical protein EHM47_02650 [Ignavibacteriales bacterium]|nr:MAG: hypothetical protein EHM47_02650 [Ignavibacteriales bacterium]
MKIENIKLLRFISKKRRAINMVISIKNNLITIDPKTIFMNVFSFLLRLILADKKPARKFNVVITNPRKTDANCE